MSDIEQFIGGMPKCELHVHIEGTLEPELKFELARRNGIALPHRTVAEMRESYDFHDLPSFLGHYYEGMRVLVTEQDFYDLMYAYLRTAHAQGVRYAEIFFDPQAHTARGVSFPTIIGGLRRAQLEGERALGIETQLIMSFLRDWSAEYAMATLLESLPYRHWIIGVGLDSDENGHPPIKFTEVFRRARAEGYLLTMHCDVEQDKSLTHIRQCLDVIGVDRIDHGVDSMQDAQLVAEIKQRGLALTVCPISNSWVAEGLKAQEITAMLRDGVRVTINSDDPAYFGGYVADNLVALAGASDLTAEDFVQLQRNAFEGTWLSRSAKDRHLEGLEKYLAERAGHA